MRISSDRPIAFVDIDGVLIKNPPEAQKGFGTITDPEFWEKHWSRPMVSQPNAEVVTLVKSLIATGWHIIFLTARPAMYRELTKKLLMKHLGFWVSDYEHIEMHSNHPKLVMIKQNEIPTSSAEWKQSVVRAAIKAGGNAALMIEDYKPNAEAVRPLVPVLLYEQKRTSDYLAQCSGCGGMSRCHGEPLCPLSSGVI